MKYNKQEAILIAKEFIAEVNKLEQKYKMNFNSDTGDIYLSYQSNEDGKYWDSISLGGEESIIEVVEEIRIKEKLKEQALAKLTIEERDALGI